METNSDEEFFDADEMEDEEIAEGREKSTKIKLLKFPNREIFVPGKLVVHFLDKIKKSAKYWEKK